MHHAAVTISKCTWEYLYKCNLLPRFRCKSSTKSDQGDKDAMKEKTKTIEEACIHHLLYNPGGGGAGGMSGFFRHIIGAKWLPGADAVADLLSLKTVIQSTGAHTSPIRSAPEPKSVQKSDAIFKIDCESVTRLQQLITALGNGLLFTNCDVLVSGEGSFDAQTIQSRKTIGRLVEMTVEANL
uniref:Uncharacterized protein n=1 Tax=Lygus hesperus TaxID=30085 RepID=A0A0A9X8S3_LYGHE